MIEKVEVMTTPSAKFDPDGMAGIINIVLIKNKFDIKVFFPYLLIGLLLWDFTHNSGIHATIAGVLLAMTIPHRKKEKDFSLLIKIEHAISPCLLYTSPSPRD